MKKDSTSAYKKRFSERLRAVRLMADHKDAKSLATALGIDENRYSAYERGDRCPPLWLIERIKEITGCSIDFLIAGENPDPASNGPRNSPPPDNIAEWTGPDRRKAG